MALEAFGGGSAELVESSAAALQTLEQAGKPAQIYAPGAPPKMKGMNKAAVLLVALGAGPASEVFKFLKEDEIEALSLEMAQLSSIPSEQTQAVFEEVVDTATCRRLLRRGRRRLRPRGARGVGRRRARRRDHRPPGRDHRDAAVRVPAPHPAGADRAVPRAGVAPDDRARHRQPAHDPGRPGARGAARRAPGPGRRPHRDDARDLARGHQGRRGGVAAEARPS